MRRKFLIGLTVGTLMGLFGTAAFATAPTVTITDPVHNEVLTFESFPQTVDVAGTVSRSDTSGGGGTHNLCGVQNFEVTVDDGTAATTIGTKTWTQGQGDCGTVSDTWSFPYEITAPGTFTVKASGQRTGTEVGEDTVAFEAQLTLVADYPAAPAVAADILDEYNVPARYGTGRHGGNHVSDVARHMGPGTDFDGVSKSEVSEYRQAVYTFLVSNDAALP